MNSSTNNSSLTEQQRKELSDELSAKLGLSSLTFPEIEALSELLHNATSKQISVCQSALQCSPERYHSWLLDCLLQSTRDNPSEFNDAEHERMRLFNQALDLFTEITEHGFFRTVTSIVSLACDPDGKDERRGYAWTAERTLHQLRNSRYADFDHLFSDCIKQEPSFWQYTGEQSQPIPDERKVVLGASFRAGALQHLPRLAKDEALCIELLSSCLQDSDLSSKNWSAVNLSLLRPTDQFCLASALFNSLLTRWDASNAVAYEFGCSGQVISTMTLLTLAAHSARDNLSILKKAAQGTLDKAVNSALSSAPADRTLAESAAAKLYRAANLEPPQMVWQLPLTAPAASSDWVHSNGDCIPDFSEGISFLPSAIDSALSWYIRGHWSSTSNSMKHVWPPGYARTRTPSSWLSSDWCSVTTKLSMLRTCFDPTLSTYSSLLTQFDAVWLALLSLIGKSLGAADERLSAMFALASSCGGVWLGTNRCTLLERPSRTELKCNSEEELIKQCNWPQWAWLVLGSEHVAPEPRSSTRLSNVNARILQCMCSVMGQTPDHLRNWLWDAFLEDESGYLLGTADQYGFPAAFFKLLDLVYRVDPNNAKATASLSVLTRSSFANVPTLFAELIRQERGPTESTERTTAMRYLPAFIDAPELVLDLLSSGMSDEDKNTRTWAAINLSHFQPDHRTVAQILFDSLFRPPAPVSERDQSIELASLLALLRLTGANQRANSLELQREVLANVSQLAISTQPSDRIRAEQAAQELYSAVGLPMPPVIWHISAASEHRSEMYELIEKHRTKVKRSQDDADNQNPISLMLPHFRFPDMALTSYITGSWVDDHVWSPPLDVSNADWLLPGWQFWLERMSNLRQWIDPNQIILTRQRHADITQFHSVALGLLAFIAQTLGVDEVRLNALLKLLQYCGGARLSDRYCVLYERPTILELDADLQAHCETGHALACTGGGVRYAWHGVTVPAKAIEAPDTISTSDIENERNVEVRRVLLDLYGVGRFVTDSGASIIDSDSFGTLYRKTMSSDEDIVMVRVTDASTDREYFLRVPPDIQTAREAVAWTFSMSASEYNPSVQT